MDGQPCLASVPNMLPTADSQSHGFQLQEDCVCARTRVWVGAYVHTVEGIAPQALTTFPL